MPKRRLELYVRSYYVEAGNNGSYYAQWKRIEGTDGYDRMTIRKVINGDHTEVDNYSAPDVPSAPATAAFKADGTLLTWTVGAKTRTKTDASIASGKRGPTFQGHLVDYAGPDTWKLGQARVRDV